MRRGERAGRHVPGLAVAGLLHVVVLTALAIGARGPPPLPEPPIVQVLLTPPPKSRAPPKPFEAHRPLTGRRTTAAAPMPPVVLPAVTEDQRQALMAAPFDETQRVNEALRRRRRCQDYVRIEDLERERCPTVARIKPLDPGQVHGKDPEGGFAQAARRKDAIRTYKDTGVNFPGLRCSFGRAC